MLTFHLPLFSFLLLFCTATAAAQPYKPTDYYLINCGSTTSTSTSNRTWDPDEHSKFVPSNTATTSFTSTPNHRDPSVPEIPYSTARIFNTSSFTYTFPATFGPKFLRLYFYPATYSHRGTNQSSFSVSSNGYALLANFSAFLTASYLGTTLKGSPPVPHFVKEFVIYVNDTQTLNVTFTPAPKSYAFINGIEIVSLPENLYHKSKSVKYVGQTTGPVIAEDTALENVYRLNVGGGQISGTVDTGMYRTWEQDNQYVFPVSARGLTPVNTTPIVYTEATPNYTAPELVYATQRSLGARSLLRYLLWLLPVDTGFYYMLRLHFCNIIPQYTEPGDVIFRIFIKNQTAEKEADVLYWSGGTGLPVFKDYVVFVNDLDGSGRKQDLWLAVGSNEDLSQAYGDAYLNGLEVFKISMAGSLVSPSPELRPTSPPPLSSLGKRRTSPYAAIIGGIGGGLVLFSALGFIVLRRTRFNEKLSGKQKSKDSGLPSGRCRRFSLQEMKDATGEFHEDCIIGKGGFGMVYKGYIDNATSIVAIKRLNASSKQGSHEFRTEIGFLSKLRHVQLVPLIGYCDDEGEMVLVYEYMANGTLQDHLYKKNTPHLTWKKRLEICIGAARGLHYLHTGANRAIIHRDVKSSNILLDENWVAKVSDFGLSRLGPKEKGQDHVTTLVKGTFGYMDPEYYRKQQLTDKSDVYSFGVVLLEVLCARPVVNVRLPYEEANLAEWGRLNYRKGTLNEIVDKKISGEIAPNCLMKFGEVANSCLRMKGSKRPKMDDVVWGLEFALQLQEAAEKTGGVVSEVTCGVVGEVIVGGLENKEFLFPMLETTISEESTGAKIQHGMSSTDSSCGGFESETYYTQTSDVSKGTSSEGHG